MNSETPNQRNRNQSAAGHRSGTPDELLDRIVGTLDAQADELEPSARQALDRARRLALDTPALACHRPCR